MWSAECGRKGDGPVEGEGFIVEDHAGEARGAEGDFGAAAGRMGVGVDREGVEGGVAVNVDAEGGEPGQRGRNERNPNGLRIFARGERHPFGERAAVLKDLRVAIGLPVHGEGGGVEFSGTDGGEGFAEKGGGALGLQPEIGIGGDRQTGSVVCGAVQMPAGGESVEEAAVAQEVVRVAGALGGVQAFGHGGAVLKAQGEGLKIHPAFAVEGEGEFGFGHFV